MTTSDFNFDPNSTLVPTSLDEIVAQPKEPAPDPAMAPGAGLEELGPNDLRLPQLKIRQPLTLGAERVPDGAWFVTSDPDLHSVIRDVVLLDVRKERSLMLPYGGGPQAEAVAQRITRFTGAEVPPDWQGPVCYSPDRVRPVDLGGLPVLSPTCGECPMNRWRTVNGRRVQDCAESLRLTLFDVVTQRPCVFFARGSAIRPVRELLAQLQAACERHQRPAFGFALYSQTKRVEGAEGVAYFVPVFQSPYPLTDHKQVAFYGALRMKLASAASEEA